LCGLFFVFQFSIPRWNRVIFAEYKTHNFFFSILPFSLWLVAGGWWGSKGEGKVLAVSTI